MRNRIVLIILVILSVGVALYLFLRSDKADAPTNRSSSESSQQEKTISNATSGGVYAEYSEAALASAEGDKILFFHASWCPQCRALEADIKKQGVPEGTSIFKVDYDNARDLRQKYGVTLQTTVVKIDDKGNLVSKFTPYSKPTLENALSNL